SDHGESLGAHDIYWDHRELYPDTLAVPLILAGPNVPKGQRRRAPLSQLDLGRTLLDLAGLGAVPFPGESLLGIPDELALAEGADPGTSVLRFALSANATSASVAVDEYFLVLHLMEHTLHADLPRLTRHRVELYNLAQDPTCASDLVLEDGERARALRRLLIKWLNSPRAANWAGAAEIMATAHLEDLAGLGYAGGAESGTGWFDEDCSCSWCSSFSQ
ncbi:MAG: sulfatase-like hydrolase/transferase, partial [Planctomycetota bacterium]|nr:sulfatase-like hydrolase/transferase [Planctomycetota bacterium]